jgi:hypothetical protein
VTLLPAAYSLHPDMTKAPICSHRRRLNSWYDTIKSRLQKKMETGQAEGDLSKLGCAETT